MPRSTKFSIHDVLAKCAPVFDATITNIEISEVFGVEADGEPLHYFRVQLTVVGHDRRARPRKVSETGETRNTACGFMITKARSWARALDIEAV